MCEVSQASKADPAAEVGSNCTTTSYCGVVSESKNIRGWTKELCSDEADYQSAVSECESSGADLASCMLPKCQTLRELVSSVAQGKECSAKSQETCLGNCSYNAAYKACIQSVDAVLPKACPARALSVAIEECGKAEFGRDWKLLLKLARMTVACCHCCK
jgi:hypothetical protein